MFMCGNTPTVRIYKALPKYEHLTTQDKYALVKGKFKWYGSKHIPPFYFSTSLPGQMFGC